VKSQKTLFLIFPIQQEIADKEGVELVILRPSAMLGPGDARFRSTHTTLSFIDRRIPFVPSGIISFVDVRDVAQCSIVGMVKENKALNWSIPAPISPSSSSNLSSSTSSSSSLVSSTSPVGKSFLLGSANWTMFEFFDAIERCSGVQKPKLRGIPTSVIKPLLNTFNNIKATMKKKEEEENEFGSEGGEEDRLSKPNPHNLPRPGCAETQIHLHRWFTGAEAPLLEIQRRREKEESSSTSWDPVKLEMSGCNWSIRATKAGPFLGRWKSSLRLLSFSPLPKSYEFISLLPKASLLETLCSRFLKLFAGSLTTEIG
jgi:hypothetical protein